MTYSIKSVFLTLQGEGARSGSKAVFVRFSGCNLWNGLESGKALGRGACSRWCDTDFVGGERVSLTALLCRVEELWAHNLPRWVVFTGGEPALQLDSAIVNGFHLAGWKIAVETNGTTLLPAGIDWVTVSPKLGALPTLITSAEELKVVLPGGDPGWSDEALEHLEASGAWGELFVQPQADQGMSSAQHVERCVSFVMAHPRWRYSTQLHKTIGIP